MANTLKFGNGQWATKEGSTLAYNDENNNYKPLPFNFERDSVATRVNKQGLIETVGADQPRIDYLNDSNGALLLEPSRTNLVTYSEDFTQWSLLSGGTGTDPIVTSNSIISPDGTQNADKIVFNSGSGTTSGDSSQINNIVSITSGTDATASVYLKGENGGEELVFRGVADGTYQKITLTTEWQRFSTTENSGTTTDAITFGIRQNVSGLGVINSNATIYAWAGQIEAGSYATSYIPTQGSAVTRLADSCNNGGNEQVINSTEGVLYAEINIPENIADNINISINDGTNDEYVKFIYLASTNVFRAQIEGSGNQAGVNTTSLVLGSYSKLAVSYKSGEFKLYINGSQIDSTLTGHTLPTGLDTLSFDRGDGAAPFQGNVKDVRVYDTALTDQELAALTQV